MLGICKQKNMATHFVNWNFEQNFTCQLNALQCSTDPKPICNDPCHTAHSSNRHRMDGHHRVSGNLE